MLGSDFLFVFTATEHRLRLLHNGRSEGRYLRWKEGWLRHSAFVCPDLTFGQEKSLAYRWMKEVIAFTLRIVLLVLSQHMLEGVRMVKNKNISDSKININAIAVLGEHFS